MLRSIVLGIHPSSAWLWAHIQQGGGYCPLCLLPPDREGGMEEAIRGLRLEVYVS